MNETWLDIKIGGVVSRADLKSGLTRLGGVAADLVIPGAPEGELHIWSDPPKVVHVSGQTPLEVNGERRSEVELASGVAVIWGSVTLTYRGGSPLIEEIPLPTAPVASSAKRGQVGALSQPPVATGLVSQGGPSAERAWDRVRAGMAIELGVADKKVVRRWQDAVVRSEFDADACAREVLACVTVPSDDPRMVERAGRLLRDFLMASLQRGLQGASRKARAQAKSGTAYVLANLIAILIYTGILAVIMVLARLKWNTSFDALFDFILGR